MSIKSLLEALAEACPTQIWREKYSREKISRENFAVRVVGGGAASDVWMQILADVSLVRCVCVCVCNVCVCV